MKNEWEEKENRRKRKERSRSITKIENSTGGLRIRETGFRKKIRGE